MLLTKLNQPEILGAIGTMGHGSRILIADGCYPFVTGSPVTARKVYLNLSPGIVLVTDVLKALAATIPLEEAFVMVPPDSADQPIFSEFRQILPKGIDLTKLQRFDFYNKSREADTALMIATGDQRNWANLLLTVGYIKH
jgi:L-fucose mutarotase